MFGYDKEAWRDLPEDQRLRYALLKDSDFHIPFFGKPKKPSLRLIKKERDIDFGHKIGSAIRQIFTIFVVAPICILLVIIANHEKILQYAFGVAVVAAIIFIINLWMTLHSLL